MCMFGDIHTNKKNALGRFDSERYSCFPVKAGKKLFPKV